MDFNKITQAYLAIRDRRAEIKREHDAADDELKAKQGQLEAVMLGHLNDSGMESVRTTNGTFFKTETLKPSASDWVAFYDFIRENDAFEALERRVKKDFVKQYMDDNEGTLPPGISCHREYEVRVRRA